MRIINFVSSAPNIGNYTPVLGVARLLGEDAAKIVGRVDCRQYSAVHVEDYDLALVGGAGLLHACFEGFWSWLAEQDMPVILWGIGVCLNLDAVPIPRRLRVGVSPSTVRKVVPRVVAASVRDDLTAEMYPIDADVSFCPTLAWLRDVSQQLHVDTEPEGHLFVEHPELTSAEERAALSAVCSDYTDNIVRTDIGGILKKYLLAETIVTTRLHGAIIANCLGRPYVALSKDRKIDAYAKRWGGGIVIHRIQELANAMDEVRTSCRLPLPDYDSMNRFATKVRSLIA